ncbi:hypothetical protein MKX08_003305 [Trichoderma sp. CBMAI-0020]|nr:hypothetical protein MKX08_003305 [Trichoderma sp. CBMAI-0020]
MALDKVHAAVVDFTQGWRPGYTYTETYWVLFTYKFEKDTNIVSAYGASKKPADKAMWDPATKEETSFDLDAVEVVRDKIPQLQN